MSFAEQVAKASIDASEDIVDIIRGSTIQLFGDIITSTPVGKPSLWQSPPPKGYTGGTLRGGWYATFAGESSEVNDSPARANSAASVMSKKINGASLQKTYILTNNLPYAQRVEYGSWSISRPRGMVRVNAANWTNIVNRNR